MPRPRKEHLDPMFGRSSGHCQVLASLKSAEASRAALVAISLGVYGLACSSHQVMASTNIADTRSGTNSSEKVWKGSELSSVPGGRRPRPLTRSLRAARIVLTNE